MSEEAEFEELEKAVRVVSWLLRAFVDGKQLTVPGLTYPLGMGADGRVGSIYSGVDQSGNVTVRVPDNWTVAQLVQLVIKHKIAPFDGRVE
jgi:hypothetical protein